MNTSGADDPDTTVLDQILPSPFRLYVWIFVALAFELIIALRLRAEAQATVSPLHIVLFAWCVGVQLVSIAKLVRPTPVIETTVSGIRFRIVGPFRSAMFVPWRRVRSVFVTQAYKSSVLALGFDILEDASFRLPAWKLGTARVDPAARQASLAFAFTPWAFVGEVTYWARNLEKRRDMYSEPS